MEKKLYKKPSVEEVKIDENIQALMASDGGSIRQPRGGRSSAASTQSVEDIEEVYSNPLEQTPYK